MTNWQSITTAPQDGTEILGWPVEGGISIIYFVKSEWRLSFDCSNFDVMPTHWQPLPEPPKETP